MSRKSKTLCRKAQGIYTTPQNSLCNLLMKTELCERTNMCLSVKEISFSLRIGSQNMNFNLFSITMNYVSISKTFSVIATYYYFMSIIFTIYVDIYFFTNVNKLKITGRSIIPTMVTVLGQSFIHN